MYNVHADHLATARVITRRSDQAIMWRWDTAEAFGATAANQNPSGLGTFVYNPRFPGQVFDAETGLLQNWNREYDARQGRYRQSDPIGLAGGINTYSYVGGNPLSFIDPSGEFGVPGAIVGGTIGVVTGGLGAYATGGNVVAGALIGGLGGALVGGLGPIIGPSLAGQMFSRATAGAVGNVLGQAQGIGTENFNGFNMGSLTGSALGGAVGGVLAPASYGTSFSGPLAGQLVQRGIAGIPGSSVSSVSSFLGNRFGQDNKLGQQCMR